jgi:hypothetical protein
MRVATSATTMTFLVIHHDIPMRIQCIERALESKLFHRFKKQLQTLLELKMGFLWETWIEA